MTEIVEAGTFLVDQLIASAQQQTEVSFLITLAKEVIF